MTAGILIVAHKPLASALRSCVQHIFSDGAPAVRAFDVQSELSMEQNVAGAREEMARCAGPQVLVLTDLFSSTPCNVAREIVDGVKSRLIAGVNLPMLLRAITYRHEPMDSMVHLTMAGGTQGVLQVTKAAPQNQGKKKRDDKGDDDHQQ